MRVRLAYGRTGLEVGLPERNLAGVLRCRPGEPLADPLAAVRRRAKIKVVSDGLPPETLLRLMVEPAESVEAAVAEALAEYGRDAAIAVIPEGSYVLAELSPAK